MQNIAKILSEFQGIIGAVTGVIATLIVTSIIKNSGKIYTYFRNWRISFLKADNIGSSVKTALEEAELCSYSFEMEIINSSSIPKALRDIRIRFYNSDNKLLIDSIPKDKSTRKTSAAGTTLDSIKIINLPSRKMIYFNISGNIGKEELKKLKNWKKVNLEATDSRGRKIKRIIKNN